MIIHKKIKNKKNEEILKLMDSIEDMDIHATLKEVNDAKNKLLEMYNNKMLWKLKYL